jgi:S-formylglutathione hydrolase FrmB
VAGQVVDYTRNHHADRRIYSPILGMPRDLYVYLPPNYNPARSYPLVLYLHRAATDERNFLDSSCVLRLDRLIRSGQIPPMIVASPDGTIDGGNRLSDAHSYYLNGCSGRFADHIMAEVVPFLLSHYSIRPEREAHAILGVSGGALGGLHLAIQYRSFFGSVALLAPPANLRYNTCHDDPREDFHPHTYRWLTYYNPDQVAATYFLGIRKIRAKSIIEPVFGSGPGVVARVAQSNPADMIFSTNLQPGELAIYLNYPELDNFNLDAQAESFAWLARSRGIAVDLVCVPHAHHFIHYFRSQQVPAWCWIGRHILPPT